MTQFWRTRQMSALERIIAQFNHQLSEVDQKAESETFQQWMQRLALQTEQNHLFEQVNQIFQKIVYLGNENQQDIQNIKKLLKECANALKVKK
jgi:ribonucleotide reductase alpha subunit